MIVFDSSNIEYIVILFNLFPYFFCLIYLKIIIIGQLMIKRQ